MPVDSSGSRKQDARPMLTTFFTQARRFRPTRNLIWFSGWVSGSTPHIRQNSRVASSRVWNRLENTYPVPNRPSIGIFQLHPEDMAIDEVYGSTPFAASSCGI